MTLKRNALMAAMGLIIAASAGAASAASAAPLDHPRRAEVSARLDHQADRIRHARVTGHMSAAKARRLHRADMRLRRQEARFARRHRGHLTKAEQHRLNRAANRISHRIG